MRNFCLQVFGGKQQDALKNNPPFKKNTNVTAT